jgi:hypothetical protein
MLAMKTTSKGTRNEKRCEDELIERGYVTWRVRRTQFGSMDMFGLFDVAGWHRKLKKFMFIQVKSNRSDKKVRESIKAAQADMPANCSAELWVWIDRKGWRKE